MEHRIIMEETELVEAKPVNKGGRPKKVKRKPGRPTIMTEPVLERLREAFCMGCTDNEACLFADISPDMLYKYQRLNPEYIKLKNLLKDTPILMARTTVVRGLKNDHNLALKFLERKKKDEFSLQEVPVAPPSNPITFINMVPTEPDA